MFFFSFLYLFFFFFFNDTATTEIYTLSLHDALPISPPRSWGTGGRSSAQRHGEARAGHAGALALGAGDDRAERVEVGLGLLEAGVAAGEGLDELRHLGEVDVERRSQAVAELGRRRGERRRGAELLARRDGPGQNVLAADRDHEAVAGEGDVDGRPARVLGREA